MIDHRKGNRKGVTRMSQTDRAGMGEKEIGKTKVLNQSAASHIIYRILLHYLHPDGSHQAE